MSFWIYFICCFVPLLVQTFLKEEFGVSLGAIEVVILYGAAFWVARRWIKRREVKAFHRDADRASMPPFEYAKSLVDYTVIEYCDSKLDQPTYVVTGYLDKLADDKVIKRPCADALIEGYTAIMNARKSQPLVSTPSESPVSKAPKHAAKTAEQAPPATETVQPPIHKPAAPIHAQQTLGYDICQRYCKRCGSPIDGASKKCTGCGKQYFKASRHALWIVPAAIVLILVGYVAFNYTQAQAAVDRGQFTTAKRYLDNLIVFDDLYPDEYTILKAGVLEEEGKYIEALQYFRAKGGSDISKEVLDSLVDLVYVTGQSLYRDGKYAEAKAYFDKVPNYKRSADYSMLIYCSSHADSDDYLPAIEQYDRLVSMIGFENAGDLILLDNRIAIKFLRGRWENGNTYFMIKEDAGDTASYNLPFKDVDGSYSIRDGIYSIGTTKIFRFKIIDEDTISAYCYKDGSTYTLYRQ